MRRSPTLCTAIALGLGLSGAAYAEHHETAPPKPEIVKRDAKGRVEVVRIDGKEYTICTQDGQDGCINPREAGLDFGNRPLKTWPGKPASEK